MYMKIALESTDIWEMMNHGTENATECGVIELENFNFPDQC